MRRVGLLATVLASLVASAAGGEERTQPLLLVLRGRNPLGLERFIARPHRRWLDPHEFGRRFGASPRSLRSATRWLRTQGLRVRHRFADRTMIQFDGPPAAVAAAFGVRLVRAHGRFRSARPPCFTPSSVRSTCSGSPPCEPPRGSPPARRCAPPETASTAHPQTSVATTDA